MSTRTDGPDTFQLANGIKLTLRQASPALIAHIRQQADADEPKVPMITREDRDGRQEPNADDPRYLAAHAKWVSETGWRTLRVLAAACVTIDEIPDGIPGPDSPEWAEQIVAVYGFDLEDNATRRMAQWLLFQTTADDLLDLGPLLMLLAGVDEREVQAALDSFRGTGGRVTDTASNANGGSPDGDTVEAPVAGSGATR